MTRNHMNAEKLCRRCNEAWPVDFFRPDKRGPGYLTPWCRACEADQKREYRARSVGAAGFGRYAGNP